MTYAYNKRWLCLLMLTILIILCKPILTYANDCPAANDFANKVSDQTLEIINSNDLTKNQKKYFLSEIFIENADFEMMGKIALGKYTRKLPPSQRSLYTQLIENMVISMLYERLDSSSENDEYFYSINNDKCKIKGSKNIEFLVDGQIDRNDLKLSTIRWWIVLQDDGSFKVIDISLAGVSLALQKREEFTSYISNNSISELIDHLNMKYNSDDK